MLVDASGEERTMDEEDVDIERPASTDAVDPLTSDPDVQAAWVCDTCICNPFFCVCKDCHEEDPK